MCTDGLPFAEVARDSRGNDRGGGRCDRIANRGGPAPKRCNNQNSQNQLRTSDISTTKGVTIKNSTDLERAPGARSKSVEFLIVTLLIVEILVCRFCLISPRCYTFREPDPSEDTSPSPVS